MNSQVPGLWYQHRVQSGSWGLKFMERSKQLVWRMFFFFLIEAKGAFCSCLLGRDATIASALACESAGRVGPSTASPQWPAPPQKEKQISQPLT